jgi:hypothetical protein
MKHINYFLSLIFLVFISCSDADDSIQKTNLSANGNWSLVKVSGSIAGVNNTFPAGMITWSFDELNHTITVVNNNSNSSLEDFFSSGVYNYSIINNPIGAFCAQDIKIDATDFGCFTETENKINISQSFTDGFDLELIKQ